jgi:hypothetical protein
MKTTTSNSIKVKARRDAWDIGGAGREDSSSIGFDTPIHVDDQRLGGDRPTSRSRTLTAGEGRTGLERGS